MGYNLSQGDKQRRYKERHDLVSLSGCIKRETMLKFRLLKLDLNMTWQEIIEFTIDHLEEEVMCQKNHTDK